MKKNFGFLKKTKKDLRPEKNFLKEVDVFVEEINDLLKEKGLSAVCVKGGSVAKNTLIIDDYDVDLFVKFDYDKYKNSDISKELQKILESSRYDFELVHGSRDYFQIKNKVVYELVPVLDITDYKQAVNVTDMSPLHVDYLRRHADSVMRDEIRLTKQFCKSIGVYGAESFIAGFSGHIIDLLIIRYKSFINLLEACTKWSEQIVIDLENHLDDPFNDLNASKIKSALVIVDPVDPNRNASAALSKEKLLLFKKKASMFLDEPSKDYFVVRPFDIENVKKKKKKDEQLIILELTPLLGKVDVVGAKLKKGYEHIKKQLNHYDFKLISDGWNWDKKNACFAYYFLEDKNLSAYFEKRGPPIDNREDVFKFKDKHKEIYTKNSYTYAKVKRKYVNPNTLIIDLLKGEYLKAKFKRAKKEVIKK